MEKVVSPSVSVIITAYNAAATIADAVTTALREPETVEVIVVDDASGDETIARAKAAAQGDHRLIVLCQAENGGPARARNRALEVACGDYVAVLDADDFFFPGRFGHLLAVPDWDMIADNILFVAESASPMDMPQPPEIAPATIDITLADFVRANHSVRGAARREWGFLKPVMRRSFLQAHGLNYDDSMRLGEDYDLYVRMLQRGARFRVSTALGYIARWRMDSLSSRHRTEDLKALYMAAKSHLSGPGNDAAAQTALMTHAQELRRRFLLRDFLDLKARRGKAGALISALAHPGTVLPIAQGILSDKLRARQAKPVSRIGQLLIED